MRAIFRRRRGKDTKQKEPATTRNAVDVAENDLVQPFPFNSSNSNLGRVPGSIRCTVVARNGRHTLPDTLAAKAAAAAKAAKPPLLDDDKMFDADCCTATSTPTAVTLHPFAPRNATPPITNAGKSAINTAELPVSTAPAFGKRRVVKVQPSSLPRNVWHSIRTSATDTSASEAETETETKNDAATMGSQPAAAVVATTHGTAAGRSMYAIVDVPEDDAEADVFTVNPDPFGHRRRGRGRQSPGSDTSSHSSRENTENTNGNSPTKSERGRKRRTDYLAESIRRIKRSWAEDVPGSIHRGSTVRRSAHRSSARGATSSATTTEQTTATAKTKTKTTIKDAAISLSGIMYAKYVTVPEGLDDITNHHHNHHNHHNNNTNVVSTNVGGGGGKMLARTPSPNPQCAALDALAKLIAAQDALFEEQLGATAAVAARAQNVITRINSTLRCEIAGTNAGADSGSSHIRTTAPAASPASVVAADATTSSARRRPLTSPSGVSNSVCNYVRTAFDAVETPLATLSATPTSPSPTPQHPPSSPDTRGASEEGATTTAGKKRRQLPMRPMPGSMRWHPASATAIGRKRRMSASSAA